LENKLEKRRIMKKKMMEIMDMIFEKERIILIKKKEL